MNISLITHLIAALLAASCAWFVQGTRMDATVSHLKAQQAQTLADIAIKTQAASKAVRDYETAVQTQLAQADTQHHQEITDARSEADDLRACVRAGTCGVRIRTVYHCEPRSAGPKDATPSSVGDGAVPLDADAGQRVLDLRESVREDAAKLSYLRAYAQQCAGAQAAVNQ